MGRISLVWRLAVADLRRRRGEGAMLVLVLVATTATLTLGLLLHGQTADAYQLTRTRTAGPDVVVYAFPPQLGTVSPADQRRLTDLRQRAGVTAGNGPYPLTWASLKTASDHGHRRGRRT